MKKTKIKTKNETNLKPKSNSRLNKTNKHIHKIIHHKNITIYYLNPIISDQKIKELEGHFFPLESFPIVSKEQNIDVYRLDTNGNRHLLMKYRQDVIPKELTKKAFQALEKEASRVHYNRGAPAGILRRSQLPPYVGELVKPRKFRTFYYGAYDLKYHQDSIGNKAQSSIIGYYDQVDRNLYRRASVKERIKEGIKPLSCRMTQFTKNEPEKWQEVVPLIIKIDKLFKKLVSDKYRKQKQRASMTPKYVIEKTAFSTITINYNWRTALHRDAGDFVEGFGNLVVLEKGDVKGGYLGFPQYGICVKVKDGDFMAMDVHQWHCNTELENTKESVRLSMVSYLREGMIKCLK